MSSEAGGAAPTIAAGCMRLSTSPDRDDAIGVAVVQAMLDAGATLLDTADAYCRDATETGHNERLIARALAAWHGARSGVRIATKGGLTRPDGQWVPDGRARHLTSACEASLRALEVSRIDLYQLHAPDPRVPFSTSIRALHALKTAGVIESIGLSNVTVGQIEEARRITDIASVQVELNVWNDAGVLSGVLAHCEANRIQLLAHRPLGGLEKRRRVLSYPVLLQLAAAHGVTPFDIALAALTHLSPVVVPLPGPTTVERAHSIARFRSVALTADDRAALSARFPTCRAVWTAQPRVAVSTAAVDGEVVLVMGLPGAGKSTIAETLVAGGYRRINRDEAGGTLRSLVPALDELIPAGSTRIVLDNTYVSRKARAAVVQAARQHGLPVRCIWVATSVEDAQINAATRILSRYGKLLGPEELRQASRTDTAAFGPTVQFRFQRELEPPELSEGLSAVDVVPFERKQDPDRVNRAVIVWCDGVLQRSRSDRRTPSSPADADISIERGAVLRRYEAEGWKLLGLSWLPEIADGAMTVAEADAIFAHLRSTLGVAIDIEYCPHAGGPPACWCRKPLPGLVVVLQQRHRLDPSRCIYVGNGPQDPGFARRFGFQYRTADQFF